MCQVIAKNIRECREYGLPEPELIDFDGDFRVNMFRQIGGTQSGAIDTNYGTIGTNHGTIRTISGIIGGSPESKMLEMMRQEPKITQKELQKKMGVSLRTVKRMMAELQDQGYITRKGNNRSGEWIVQQ